MMSPFPVSRDFARYFVVIKDSLNSAIRRQKPAEGGGATLALTGEGV
jgi:hypothetical protein